jgi:hypothetical protein
MRSGNHASCRKMRDANHVADADEATDAIDATDAADADCVIDARDAADAADAADADLRIHVRHPPLAHPDTPPIWNSILNFTHSLSYGFSNRKTEARTVMRALLGGNPRWKSQKTPEE